MYVSLKTFCLFTKTSSANIGIKDSKVKVLNKPVDDKSSFSSIERRGFGVPVCGNGGGLNGYIDLVYNLI